MKYSSVPICTIFFCFFISGCMNTALKTSNDKTAAGLPYYLAKGMVNLKIKQETEKKTLAIEIAKVEIVPDDSYRYILQYNASKMSDDALSVTTTKTGLLSEIKFTADDHTDEFIIKIAELAKEGAKLAFTPFGLVQEGKNYEIIYDAYFDPFTDLSKINQAIKSLNSGFRLEFPILDSIAGGRPIMKLDDCNQDYICFRTTSVFPLILKEKDNEIQRVNLELPDPTRLGQIDITRAAFVKKITNLTFENGSLTKIDINKPSEAIAAIEIPINIAKSIASIPAELIKFRIDHSTNNKTLFDNLRNELESKKALENLQNSGQIEGSGDPLK